MAGNDVAVIPAAEAFPIAQIAALEADTRKYAADLQNVASSDEWKALQAQRQELADRITLRAHLPTIQAEIARLQSIRFLDHCLADTITTLGNKIADQVLTPRLRDQFASEIIELAGRSVRVEMVRAGGQYGSPQYQVRLLAAPATNVTGVLSEGEQTCVATRTLSPQPYTNRISVCRGRHRHKTVTVDLPWPLRVRTCLLDRAFGNDRLRR